METCVVVLIVYVGDIIVSSSDVAGIKEVKDYFKNTSRTKDLRLLHYFWALKFHMVEVRLFCLKGSMYWNCLMKLTC